MSKNRVEAFSDGVFAVAITILIFNIEIPKVGPGGLLGALESEWPALAAYVASFLTIGVMWINHHSIFERLAGMDRALMVANLLLLMSIAFIPFPTAVLGRYLSSSTDAVTAATFYAAVCLVISLAFGITWTYALRTPRLLSHAFDRETALRRLPRYTVGFLVYLTCIPVARFSPRLVVVLCAAAALYYLVERLPPLETAHTQPRENA